MKQKVFRVGTLRLVGETEMFRKKERRKRKHHPVDLFGFFNHVRSVFCFLFVAAALVFTFNYRADLQQYVVSHLYRWSQASLANSTLRQGAINHENEVNQAGRKF